MATIKQKKAFKEIGVNGGNISQAMKEAGYSKEVAKRTDKLTKTRGWQELMEKFLPDKDLARVHQEGLAATTKRPHLIDRDDKGRPVYDYIDEDDYATRHRYLDSAYKLKGLYAPEKSINLNINEETPEAKMRGKAFNEWFKKQQTA